MNVFRLVLFFTLSANTFAASLTVGDVAPPLDLKEWVKGQDFARKGVYVIEFWATWCAPCVAMVPHLTALQNQYGDKIPFVSIASSENGNTEDEKLEVVKKFVLEKEAEISYRVAFDRNGAIGRLWSDAAEENGIPHVFVIDKDGRIAFIGYPWELDPVLPQILAGTWDRIVHQQVREVKKEKSKAHFALMRGLSEALDSEQWDEVLAICGKIVALDPQFEVQVATSKLRALIGLQQTEAARIYAGECLEAFKDHPVARTFLLEALCVDPLTEKGPWHEVARRMEKGLEPAILREIETLRKTHPNLSFGSVLLPLVRFHLQDGNRTKAMELAGQALTFSQGEDQKEVQAKLHTWMPDSCEQLLLDPPAP